MDALFQWHGSMRSLQKQVPTDMNWAPTFPGHMALVSLHCIDRGKGSVDFMVTISGGDDTSLVWRFSDIDSAISCYDQVKHIQSDMDLEFTLGVFDGNGWPSARQVFTSNWYDTQQEDNVIVMSGDRDQWDPWKTRSAT